MARAGFVSCLLKLCAVATFLPLLAACGSAMGGDPHACDMPPVAGVWDVSLDHGEGKIGAQRWTISRDYCMLDVVAEPRDEYTPDWALVELGTGFWGTPINTVGPLRLLPEHDSHCDRQFVRRVDRLDATCQSHPRVCAG